MRFLPYESEGMQAEIEAHCFAYADFKFIKRQGKLHVFYQKNRLPFKFFRKESTHLSSNGKWEKRTVYSIFDGSKPREVEGWLGVIDSFQVWLKNLSEEE